MLRWVAAGVVVLGCGYLGISYTGAERQRVRQLSLLEQMFCQLEFNLVFLAKPLKQGIRDVSESHNGAMGKLFFQVAERMDRIADRSPNDAFLDAFGRVDGLYLKEEDKEILSDFFRHAGRGDKENTKNGIHMTVAKLKNRREMAMTELEKDGKLWRSMGFLGGCLIVLLLI